jgi:hypothetical protein
MAPAPPSGVDMLAWFSEDERSDCSSCRRRESVGLPAVRASFCLGCGAISIGDLRIDQDGRILPQR